MESKELALTCARLADNKKAEDITLLDLRELSSVADYFVIVTGTNEPHLRAQLLPADHPRQTQRHA